MPDGLLERGIGGSIFDLNGFLPSGEASAEARSHGMMGGRWLFTVPHEGKVIFHSGTIDSQCQRVQRRKRGRIITAHFSVR